MVGLLFQSDIIHLSRRHASFFSSFYSFFHFIIRQSIREKRSQRIIVVFTGIPPIIRRSFSNCCSLFEQRRFFARRFPNDLCHRHYYTYFKKKKKLCGFALTENRTFRLQYKNPTQPVLIGARPPWYKLYKTSDCSPNRQRELSDYYELLVHPTYTCGPSFGNSHVAVLFKVSLARNGNFLEPRTRALRVLSKHFRSAYVHYRILMYNINMYVLYFVHSQTQLAANTYKKIGLVLAFKQSRK